MMVYRMTLTTFALTATAVAAVPSVGAQQVERYQLTGRRVAVYNLAGAVTLAAGSGSAVQVEVTRGGGDAGDLEVATGAIDDRETLRVIYPADVVVYRPDRYGRSQTTLRVRDDGTFGGDADRWRRGRRVEVRSDGRGMDAYADLTIRIPQGQEFAIYLGAGRVSASNVDGTIRIDTHAGGVTSTDSRGPLTIDTGSGSVRVHGADGDVDVDTGSGGVEVTGVRGDRLHVDTGSGSVDVSQATVRDIDIDTGSGRIEVSSASATTIRLDTGSGGVRAAFGGSVDQVEIDTGSGSVDLTLPESFSATVDIETGSGGIDVDFPIQVRRWERDRVRGVIGNGSGRLMIDTGSGSVTIRKQ